MAKRSRKQKKRRIKAYVLRVIFVLGIITVAALLIFGAVKLIGTLTGDGRGTTDGNTVVVAKNGSIEGKITDTFDKDYYDADGLRTMIDSEISEYAGVAGNDKAVTLKKYDEKDGKVELVLDYATASDYRTFNGKQLYVGTVDELSNSGVDFNLALTAAGEDKNVLPAGEILTHGEYHAVVLEEKLNVKVPKKILYTSGNVTLIDGKIAQISGDDEALAYIIYK